MAYNANGFNGASPHQKADAPVFATTDLTSQPISGDGYYTTSQGAPTPEKNMEYGQENGNQRGTKRKFPGRGGPGKFKKQPKIDLTVPQNPISLLSILKPGIVYNIEANQEGQPQSGFKCCVKVS